MRCSLFSIFFLLVGLHEIHSQQPWWEIVTNGRSGSLSNGLADFTTKLLQNLPTDTNENIAVAPTSLAIVLAILQQGATGNAEKELTNALSLTAESSADDFKKFIAVRNERKSENELDYTDGVFVNKDSKINDSFKNKVKDYFNADIESVDFRKEEASASYINSWISNATNGKLTDLLSNSDLPPTTLAALVNAVNFRGVWQYKFNKTETVLAPFYVQPNQPVQAYLMSQFGTYVYDGNIELGAKWVELPFVKYDYSMIFIVPTGESSLNDVIERLTPERLQQILTSTKKSDIKVSIPRLNVTSKINLISTLQQLGVNQIFSDDSGLTKISSTPFIVSRALQGVKLTVDEDGSLAAAGTIISGNNNINYPIFTVDKPFLALIVDKADNSVIFLTKILNPNN